MRVIGLLKRIISTVAIFVLGFACCAEAVALDNASVSAQCAVLVDSTSGSVLYGKNEHQRASMASTTKIMTALILCEQPDLSKNITVTDKMVRVEGSSMGLLEGDVVSYHDLLYGLLLASGNDAANAVALSVAGSFENFAKLMNERAKAIGMNNTNFVTPSGLDDDNHYSTAYDMALLTCEAMKNPYFAEACKCETARLEFGNPPYKRTIRNHNKLLQMYDNCVGVKTGFTKKSGRCLVSCAEDSDKRVIAVTLNAPDDWNDHIKLLNYGLDSLTTRQFDLSNHLKSVRVIGGDKDNISLSVNKVSVSLPEAEFDKLTYKIDFVKDAFAPINKGTKLGSISICIDNKVIKKVDCVAAENVGVFSPNTNKNILYWFGRLLSA